MTLKHMTHNADDIEDCHRVGNKGQNIIKFGKRKVSRQVSVRKGP